MSWQRRKNSRSCTPRSLLISSTTALALLSEPYRSMWTSSLTTVVVTWRRRRGNNWTSSVFFSFFEHVIVWVFFVWFFWRSVFIDLWCFVFPSEIQAGAKLSLNRQFMDERWSKHRVVTCLDWSLQVFFFFFVIKPNSGTNLSEHHLEVVCNYENVNLKN